MTSWSPSKNIVAILQTSSVLRPGDRDSDIPLSYMMPPEATIDRVLATMNVFPELRELMFAHMILRVTDGKKRTRSRIETRNG